MKTSIDILKTWFQTGDKPTENQFENLIDSFYHKDDGNIITSYKIYDNGNISFTFSDGNNASFEKFILPNTMPVNFIDGLVNTLNSKVNTETGKQLSEENFTSELKQKLEDLNNYIHPEFHQITEIEGLQEIIENKVDITDGKQLSDENFTTEEKAKLASLENYVAPDSKPISYIEELEDSLTKINQDLDGKVDNIDGKQLSDENFTTEEKEKLANFNINTFSSVTDGENSIEANGQADQLVFKGAKIDTDNNIIVVENNSSIIEIDIDLEYFNTKDDKEIKTITLLKNPEKNSVIIPKNVTIVGYTEPFTEYGYVLSLAFADLTKESPYERTFHTFLLANLSNYSAENPSINNTPLFIRHEDLKAYTRNFQQGIKLIGEPNKIIDTLKGKLKIRMEYFTLKVREESIDTGPVSVII
ncbi:hypothetical protein [Tenacibaculum jejuense]|uniref:Uncharacterized protein n=1 Tax=Tenacibaculum jejuense TaxID=584609 RepID=A0A238UDH9_9FLAO|nr:hypothetical protein [Tenacibaculum jejuense]SNR16544.1 protein of unknown function [Tenacibaculum jejuense]